MSATAIWVVSDDAAAAAAVETRLRADGYDCRKRIDAAGFDSSDLVGLIGEVSAILGRPGDIAETLNSCAAAIVVAFGFSAASVWVPNAAGDRLFLTARTSESPDRANDTVAIGEGLVGQAARDSRPAASDDPERSAWAFPLVVEGRLAGVLALQGGAAPPRLTVVEILANVLAVGVERKRLADLTRQSAALATAGELAGGVAHDFNNLLTVINGYTEMLPAQLAESSPAQRSVKAIRHAGRQAAALSRQLVSMTRSEPRRPTLMDLNGVLAATTPMIERLMTRRIEVRALPCPDAPSILADPLDVERLLINLAANARDAMPDGGQLLFETRLAHHDRTGLPGEWVRLTVRDTGIGMSPATLARAFEPFFTTKHRGRGTGLGLTAVANIVSQSDGYYSVESHPGVGTAVHCYFPRCRDVAEVEMSDEPSFLEFPGTESVLLAEDEPAVRLLVRHVLRTLGYRTLDAAGGHAALRLAAEQTTGIDLLISDVVMPEMDGRELAGRLRATSPKVKVLFLSGYTADWVMDAGAVGGSTAFLQKPFTPGTLARAIRELLDRPV